MKFSFKDFFSKCDQIRSFLRIFSQLLKKSLKENLFISRVKSEAALKKRSVYKKDKQIFILYFSRKTAAM